MKPLQSLIMRPFGHADRLDHSPPFRSFVLNGPVCLDICPSTEQDDLLGRTEGDKQRVPPPLRRLLPFVAVPRPAIAAFLSVPARCVLCNDTASIRRYHPQPVVVATLL